MKATRWCVILSVLCFTGCGEDGGSEAVDEGPAEDVSVATSLGLDIYLGQAEAIVESEEGDTTVYAFDKAQGPMCLRGEAYRTSVRDTESEDLLIFLQGGGACWSEFCLAVTAAPPGIPAVDVLDTTLDANPVKDWDVVYLPYCDGSFFAGDRDHDDDGDGTDERFHRGLQNLSAALTVAQARFPSPRRVLLAGSSGGAYGTLLGTALVRHIYPDAKLTVMADSGMGLGRPDDGPFVDKILDEFNLLRFLPPDCPECLEGGHLTGLVGWYLDRDPEVRVGMFSSWYDGVLADIFLKVDPEAFRDAVAERSEVVSQAHPARFRRFIVDGAMHTTLLGDPTGIIGSDLGSVEVPPELLTNLGSISLGGLDTTAVGEVAFSDWFEAMLDEDDAVWVDVIEAPGPPPAAE